MQPEETYCAACGEPVYAIEHVPGPITCGESLCYYTVEAFKNVQMECDYILIGGLLKDTMKQDNAQMLKELVIKELTDRAVFAIEELLNA